MNTTTNRVNPKRGQTYTLEQILNVLYLRDSPCLQVTVDGRTGPVQDSHMTDEEFLAIDGARTSLWEYVRETSEWIPVFKMVSPQVPTDLFDVEPLVLYDGTESDSELWVVPKGFPRKQREDEGSDATKPSVPHQQW